MTSHAEHMKKSGDKSSHNKKATGPGDYKKIDVALVVDDTKREVIANRSHIKKRHHLKELPIALNPVPQLLFDINHVCSIIHA